MESIQLSAQSSPATATAAESSGQKDGGQSLLDAACAGFTSLLVTLLSPSQPQSVLAAAMPAKAEGAGQAAASPKGAATETTAKLVTVLPLIRISSDTAGSTAAQIVPAAAPAQAQSGNAVTVKEDPSKEGTVQLVLPDASIILKMIPIGQGTASASEAGSQLGSVQKGGNNSHQPNVKEGPVQVISIPLTAIKGGEMALPLQLPTGERLTLLLKDLPGVNSTTTGQGQQQVLSAALTEPSHGTREAVSQGTPAPAASGEVIRVVLQIKLPSGPQETPANAGQNSGTSDGVIRIALQAKPSPATPVETRQAEPTPTANESSNNVVLQAKPSAAAPVETRQVEPTPTADDSNRVVSQAKPSTTLPVETRQATTTAVAADKASEPASARPAVFTVQPHEPVQHHGKGENGEGRISVVGAAVTAKVEPLPSTQQATDVKNKSVPEIRVLNQSSRPVEIVVQQQEPTNGQAVIESVSRTTEDKSSVMEIGGPEAALPGKTAKDTLLPDAVTGKETVSAMTTPATDQSGKAPDIGETAKPAVSADNIVDQVMQKVSSVHKNLPSEITVKLQPEHLGNLHMKVAVEGNQVAVKIHVETPMAKQMLENNLGQLRQSFGDLGLKMDSVSVSLGMNTGWDRGHNPMWQDGRGHNGFTPTHHQAEPRRQEQFVTTPRTYPVRIDRLLDMTI